jgi:hypothetical protein
MVLDIAKDRLDGLANERDHAPHEFHRISSRQALSSAARDLCARRPFLEPSMAPLLRVAARGTVTAKPIAGAAKLCEVCSIRLI